MAIYTKCPHCGAPIKAPDKTVCEYCGTVLESQNKAKVEEKVNVDKISEQYKEGSADTKTFNIGGLQISIPIVSGIKKTINAYNKVSIIGCFVSSIILFIVGALCAVGVFFSLSGDGEVVYEQLEGLIIAAVVLIASSVFSFVFGVVKFVKQRISRREDRLK